MRRRGLQSACQAAVARGGGNVGAAGPGAAEVAILCQMRAAGRGGAAVQAERRRTAPAAGRSGGGKPTAHSDGDNAAPPAVRTKGVRSPRAESDGLRVLVTRHSPYKVKKESYDEWRGDLAPSRGLLRRYRRGEIGREGFDREYAGELRESAAACGAARGLHAELGAKRRVTLLFDTRDGRGRDARSAPNYHHALREIIERPDRIWPGGAGGGAPRAPSLEPDKALRERLTDDELDLRGQIIRHMVESGFTVNPHLRPERYTGEAYRRIQRRARDEQVVSSRAFLSGALEAARKACPDGADIDPGRISLEIREVRAGEPEADLFRWWNLVWWSMPHQRAYGRQMRLLLWDRAHDAPFGLVSLQSPLLRMGVRDRYLGISRENAELYANMSMSAQRVGALPPYNDLIGGKMAALAMTSDEVRRMYRKKYRGRTTVMKGRVLEPNLLFVTTTSAFGASSMYDRLTYGDGLAAVPIGFTSGAGTFHLPDSLTRRMFGLMEKRDVDTRTTYGNGPSRKLRLFKESFKHLGLGGFHRHGIRRQVYLFPLARNLPNVIQRGKRPLWVKRPLADAEEYWRKRWAVPRSMRATKWRSFKASAYFDGVSKLLGSG